MNLNKNAINRTTIAYSGNALSDVYWTSTECNTDYTYLFVLPGEKAVTNSKNGTLAVRAVKAF